MTRPRMVAALRELRNGERGSAIIEFITLAVLIVIPTVYLMLFLARIQAGTFSAESMSYQAARTVTVTPAAQRSGAVERENRLILNDQGFGNVPESGRVSVTCQESTCAVPGSRVVATASVPVDLPGISGFMGLKFQVTVRSTHTHVVDPLQATP